MSDKSDAPPRRRPATELVHGGRDPFQHFGFVNTPVYRGSTVLYPSLEAIETGKVPYTYGRKGSPSMRALEDALTALEGGERTMLVSSGLAAVSTAILAFAGAGDHILVADTVYRPTRQLCDEVLRRLGIETTYYDPLLGAGIAALLRPNTKVVYAESPGSQTFEVQDLPAIGGAIKASGAYFLVDNTWATPLYHRPLALGADVSIHAATKYVVGHADAMLGAVTANARAAVELVKTAWGLGACAGTEEIFLGLRGLRTMDVRLDRHWRSGLEMARWLGERPEVARVLHPALPDFPGHGLWKRDFSGASGLFSVVLKPVGKEGLRAMLDHLSLFGMGYSWGGYESLVVPFDPASYRTATKWVAAGPALRFHIGLEAVEDLQADLAAGFARMAAALA